MGSCYKAVDNYLVLNWADIVTQRKPWETLLLVLERHKWGFPSVRVVSDSGLLIKVSPQHIATTGFIVYFMHIIQHLAGNKCGVAGGQVWNSKDPLCCFVQNGSGWLYLWDSQRHCFPRNCCPKARFSSSQTVKPQGSFEWEATSAFNWVQLPGRVNKFLI